MHYIARNSETILPSARASTPIRNCALPSDLQLERGIGDLDERLQQDSLGRIRPTPPPDGLPDLVGFEIVFAGEKRPAIKVGGIGPPVGGVGARRGGLDRPPQHVPIGLGPAARPVPDRG